MDQLKIYTAFIGSSSVAAIQAVQSIPVDELIKAITQLAVAVATIWHLFKKNGKSYLNDKSGLE